MKWTTNGEWIEDTVYHDQTPYFQLDEREAEALPLILPALKRELIKAERRFGHFYGLHDAGVATAGQQDKMFYWEIQREFYKRMIRDIQRLIKNDKK
jgi:hypothetical protein